MNSEDSNVMYVDVCGRRDDMISKYVNVKIFNILQLILLVTLVIVWMPIKLQKRGLS